MSAARRSPSPSTPLSATFPHPIHKSAPAPVTVVLPSPAHGRSTPSSCRESVTQECRGQVGSEASCTPARGPCAHFSLAFAGVRALFFLHSTLMKLASKSQPY